MRKLMVLLCIIFISVPAWAQFNIPSSAIQYKYNYINSASTTTVKSGRGQLHNLTLEGGSAGAVTIYDSTSASGPIISNFDSTNSLFTYTFDVNFSSGCTVVTGAATKNDS